jgi:hypothetical protein
MIGEPSGTIVESMRPPAPGRIRSRS